MIQHPNDISREGKPPLWIFRGKLMALPVAGVAAGLALFRILMNYDVDLFLAIPFACLPLLVTIIFVLLYVNGKPPSYANDLLMLTVFRNRVRLHQHGWIVQPPRLWIEEKKPSHPKEF